MSYLVPALGVLLFAAFWCAVCGVIARFGWVRFAARFPARFKPEGQRFRGRSGFFCNGKARYNGCLNVVLAREGIHLEISFPFRFAHQPMLIPWGSVSAVREKKTFVGKWIEVEHASSGECFYFTLPYSARESLVSALGSKAQIKPDAG